MSSLAKLSMRGVKYFPVFFLACSVIVWFFSSYNDEPNSPIKLPEISLSSQEPHYGNLYHRLPSSCTVSLPGISSRNGRKTSRVLVTGVAGFIASHVARYCSETLDMEVIGVDDLSALGNSDNVPRSVTFVEGDLKDLNFVSCVFSEYGPFETIYHIAAYGGQGMSHFIRNSLYSTNILASVNIINQAISTGAKHFVFTSSCAVYGSMKPPLSEDRIPVPGDPYAISKLAIEQDLIAAEKLFGLKYTIFRPHNVYGPGQGINDRFRNVMGIWIRQIMNGHNVTIFGDGSQKRAFTYVGDIAPLIASAPIVPNADNRIINVGSSTAYEIRQVVEMVGISVGMKTNIQFVSGRTEVPNVEPEHFVMGQVFGSLVGKETSLKLGIKAMATWALDRKAIWVEDAFHVPPEISKKMPKIWYESFEKKGWLPVHSAGQEVVPKKLAPSSVTKFTPSFDAEINSTDVKVGEYVMHAHCRFDDHKLVDFLDFGLMPLGNNFLPPNSTAEEFANEKYYPLTVKFCPFCGAVQVNIAPRSQGTVWKDYLYRSSVIKALSDEFVMYASQIRKELPKRRRRTVVLEIGCNDGVFLKPLAALGVKVVGVDPAESLITGLAKEGYNVMNDFFGKQSAEKLVAAYGKFSSIVSSNSFAHVDNMKDIMEGITIALRDDGFLAIQVHYLVSMIEGMQYDWIYHEHMSYYSLYALERFLQRYGLEVYFAEQTPMHGGSLRIFAQFQRTGGRPIGQSVHKLRAIEMQLGAYKVSYLETFASKMEKQQHDLRSLLVKLKGEGASIIGYGAPARATTISGYVGFGLIRQHVSAVIDDADSKQGTFMPGSHVPIVSSAVLHGKQPPTHLLLFAWPWRKNIILKNRQFLDNGGKYIIPLPVVQIIDANTDLETIR